MCCFGRISSNLQLWLIMHPNCLTRPLLSFLYFIDLMVYSSNPKEFLVARRKALRCKTFVALGKIIVGDYNLAADIINSPQKRGPYLGRAKLSEKLIHPKFLLLLSDKEAGGSDLHQKLHQHFWSDLAPCAERIIERDAVQFDTYITEGLAGGRDSLSLEKMTIKCIFHAFAGVPPSEKVQTAVYDLFVSNGLTSSYVGGAIEPLSKFVSNCMRGARRKNIKTLGEFLLTSPLMQDPNLVKPEFEMESNEEYAELVSVILGIAGVLGTFNLIHNVLTLIPPDAKIDMHNDHEVVLAMLEAARLKAPVNNINVILTEERTLTVNNKSKTLPIGTVLASSIGLASLDPSTFPEPERFNHKRHNLLSHCINFNSLGFESTGVGTRVCPGRNVALMIVKKVIQSKYIAPKVE